MGVGILGVVGEFDSEVGHVETCADVAVEAILKFFLDGGKVDVARSVCKDLV